MNSVEVLKKSKMPNGIGIQIEDWREDYFFIRNSIESLFGEELN